MERAELEQRLTCVECGDVSDERAEGWQAHLAGGVVDGVDIGELEVAVCCPACAAAEFDDEKVLAARATAFSARAAARRRGARGGEPRRPLSVVSVAFRTGDEAAVPPHRPSRPGGT